MGGGSEKSLSDWMVRPGTERRGRAHSQAGGPPEPVESRVGSQGPTGAHPARSGSLCSRFHGPSVLPWKQGPGSPCGSQEATGALLGLGRVPAEGAEAGSPEKSLLPLLGSQLLPLL